ncbi:MAG: hypothetical protein CME65_01200 [Halobacteriovoraceae bacterium]|nr:hypothetical protein [Halobacteriovoraceae bacterium]
MRRIFSHILVLLLCCQFAMARVDNCRNILNWIYSDLTIENLDRSYDRLMNKFLLGLMHVHQRTQNDYRFQPEMTRIFNTLAQIDGDFNPLLAGNFSRLITSFFYQTPNLTPSNMNTVFESWRNLQRTSPDLFEGLDPRYLLDDWDQVTINTLGELSQYEFDNQAYRQRLNLLASSLENAQTNVLNGDGIDVDRLRTMIDLTEGELNNILSDKFENTMNEFGEICTSEDLSLLIQQESFSCPVRLPAGSSDLSNQLNLIGNVLNQSESLLLDRPSLQLGDNTEVELTDYPRNDRAESTYCLRNPDLISMIVIHHTETPSSSTPQYINEIHLDKVSGGEPWYMVGYNYLISESFNPGEVSVVQGRPPNIKGAHAGGYTPPLSAEERAFYADKTIMCGNRHIGFTEVPVLSTDLPQHNQMNSEGGLSGNLISYGIAVVGNYAPRSYREISGIITPVNLYASPVTPPVSLDVLRRTATVACDLQKENPNIRTIVPHRYFKYTKCPGSIMNNLQTIANLAQAQGCQFDIQLNNSSLHFRRAQ